MKRLFSCVCTFVAAFILMSMTGVVTASASTGSIDTSHAKDGFVTVNYASDSKLKVGIQYGDNKTSYKNCPAAKLQNSLWTRAMAHTLLPYVKTFPVQPIRLSAEKP